MKIPAAPAFRLLPLATALIAANAMAQKGTPQPPSRYTPTQMVETLHSVFGEHHARAIHTKGIMLGGSFTPSPSAAQVSLAPHLNGSSVPVIVRFSNFAGVPDVPDNAPLASPRGLAIRFMLTGGSSTDIVSHSFNGFPSQNADQFRELLQAIAASGPTAAKPTALDGYLATHPAARHFLTAPKPDPVSYATLPYYGVNTFKFINASGKVTYGRYQILPIAPAQYLGDAQAKAAAPDYLAREIGARVAKGAVRFRLVLQIAEHDDLLDDPSVAWPDSRRQVELGTLTIDHLVADGTAAEKNIVFMPNSLPKGIEVEDQMVNFRAAAYAVSFSGRH